MQLLQELYKLRYAIAKQNTIPAFCVMHNSVLALLATDKPTSRDEFIAVKGVSVKAYEKYGDIFIDAIKKYVING